MLLMFKSTGIPVTSVTSLNILNIINIKDKLQEKE